MTIYFVYDYSQVYEEIKKTFEKMILDFGYTGKQIKTEKYTGFAVGFMFNNLLNIRDHLPMETNWIKKGEYEYYLYPLPEWKTK